MKTILAVLFSTAFSADCAPTDGQARSGDGAAAECDCKNVKCAANEVCLVAGDAGFCGNSLTTILDAVEKCKKTDGSEATDKNCICGTKETTGFDATKLKAHEICLKDEKCTVDTSDATKNKCDAKSSGNSATMITAFATIMTTAFFSF